MGIKIVSQPVGAPILAAASTAMAQANQRTAERQSEMWQQQVEHKYRTKAINEANDFNFGRQQAMAPIPAGVQGNLRASSAYGKLQDEARNIYSGMTIDPHSEAARKRLAEIAEDMRMLREVNPDPTPEEAFDKGRIFLDPSGSRLGPDGLPYKTKPEGGSELWLDPKTGTYGPPPVNPAEEAKRKEADKAAEKEAARAQKEAERAAAAKEKAAQSWVDDQKTFANDERKRKLDALKDKEGDHTKEIDAINSEYQQRLDSLNNYMQNYGLRQPESQPPVAGPIPTGSELVGGALGPSFPPSQTTPGGGVLAPPAAAPPLTIEDMQKDAAEAQALADKGLVQEPDGTVRPATPAERGAAPPAAAPPAAAPAPTPEAGQPLEPQQITDMLDRAKASDPTNSTVYDQGIAALNKLKSGVNLSNDEKQALKKQAWDAFLQAQAAGLGMVQ